MVFGGVRGSERVPGFWGSLSLLGIPLARAPAASGDLKTVQLLWWWQVDTTTVESNYDNGAVCTLLYEYEYTTGRVWQLYVYPVASHPNQYTRLRTFPLVNDDGE